VDGNDAWWNHNGHLATHSKSLMISTMNAHGWNVEWIRTKFSSSAWEVINGPHDHGTTIEIMMAFWLAKV